MLGVAPVGRLHAVPPEVDRRRIAVERIANDPDVLAMLDRDALDVPHKGIPQYDRLPGVAAPETVPRAFDAIPHEGVPRERRLHYAGGREREIVRVEEIVVGSALAGVHGVLAGAAEDRGAGRRPGIGGTDGARALP